jgi:heme exporter protein A
MSLVAENLACERNGRVLFADLSFALAAGQLLELRGANGAGKSSLLRLLAGLVPSSAGQVHFQAGHDFYQQCHFIAHQDATKLALSVENNLQFWCSVMGGHSIAEAMDVFNLQDLAQEPAHLLSAGQRRRLALARLLVAKRPLWLLDEPMTALDATSQKTLRHVISAHLGDGGLVVAATHGDLGLSPHVLVNVGAP